MVYKHSPSPGKFKRTVKAGKVMGKTYFMLHGGTMTAVTY